VNQMSGIALTIILLLFALAAIWVVVRQLRVYSRATRAARRIEGYEPIVDPNPPPRVVRTGGVVAVSTAAFVWAGMHFVSAVAWVVTGFPVGRTVKVALVAVYLCAAGTVSTIGALMLLRCERYGRRALAMGQFLFILAAFMGIAIALLLPRGEEIPSQWYEAAAYGAAGMALHLLIDAILGAAAQHVGRPAEADNEAAQRPGE